MLRYTSAGVPRARRTRLRPVPMSRSRAARPMPCPGRSWPRTCPAASKSAILVAKLNQRFSSRSSASRPASPAWSSSRETATGTALAGGVGQDEAGGHPAHLARLGGGLRRHTPGDRQRALALQSAVRWTTPWRGPARGSAGAPPSSRRGQTGHARLDVGGRAGLGQQRGAGRDRRPPCGRPHGERHLDPAVVGPRGLRGVGRGLLAGVLGERVEEALAPRLIVGRVLDLDLGLDDPELMEAWHRGIVARGARCLQAYAAVTTLSSWSSSIAWRSSRPFSSAT
jgi:hypothetical protein